VLLSLHGPLFARVPLLSTFPPMEIGIYTFAETRFDPTTGRQLDVGGRLRDLLEEIELADEVGLDVFGVGEHHRPDYAVSAPAVALATAATRTKRIRLTSAVSVLSSDEPVRVFQNFATLDQISGGRAEIMVGRGSFTESFPFFGQDLSDYDELFSEKLDLLLRIREEERITWSGRHRLSVSSITATNMPLATVRIGTPSTRSGIPLVPGRRVNTMTVGSPFVPTPTPCPTTPGIAMRWSPWRACAARAGRMSSS
jgi:alkanesulfonate monooxygenase SsuD/methylene tetrahydromethanopterin reductase-like flavin-dependent oxidoreductase (luciferase family)